MKREIIEEWDGITDYRPPVFKEYEFDFKVSPESNIILNPKKEMGIRMAGLNYACEIVGDPSNDLWVERRKLTDAFTMGIEYAKRYLNATLDN